MLNIVQVMDNALDQGNIAVHCHAGLGRTGLAIACLLMYKERMDAETAIRMVREHRPGSIQTRKQTMYVTKFENYLQALRIVFSPPTETRLEKRLSLPSILRRQRLYHHGHEQRRLRFTPKILTVLIPRLLGFNLEQVHNEIVEFQPFDELPQYVLDHTKEINEDIYFNLQAETHCKVLVEILMHWITSLKTPIISQQQLEIIPRVLELPLSNEKITLMDREVVYTVHCLTDLLRTESPCEAALKKLCEVLTSSKEQASLEICEKWILYLRNGFVKGEDLGIEFSPVINSADSAIAEIELLEEQVRKEQGVDEAD